MRVLAIPVVALALMTSVAAQQQPRRPSPPTPPPRADVKREATVPFAAGEALTYDVSWSNLLTAGTAVTRVVQKRPSFNATAYEIVADGRPLPLLARLYPVYYKMDTLLDTVSLLSQWTGLYTEENTRKRQTSMRFDRDKQRIHYELTTEPASQADLTAPAGIQDGLSLLYALRTRTYKAGDRFAVPVADDGSLYTVNFEVFGPEQVSVRIGPADAWRLAITIVDKDRKPVGQNIGVWISTDARRLPMKIQADLPVGSFVLGLREAK